MDENGRKPDSLLPWDHLFHAEIGLASANYTRKDAEPLAQAFFKKYERMIKSPEAGFRYTQGYDLKTKKIVNPDYLKIQDEVRAEFSRMGFEILPYPWHDIMEYLARRLIMGKAKIAITLDAEYIGALDRLVKANYFQNRSQAIGDAVREKLVRMTRCRLSMECAKLDPKFEKAMAEEGLAEDVSQWPEY